MKESPKYAIVNNSFQRVSPHRPDVSLFNINTNNSFEVQSQVSVGSSYGLRSRSIHMPKREDPIIEDGKLMIRYLMACVELERMGRLCQKIKLARYNEQQVMRQFRTEHELLKASLHAKSKEVTALNEQSVDLQRRLRHVEQQLRQKERQLSQKDDEIRSTRLELTGMSLSHSRFQHNEKNRVKELQAELMMERNRYGDLMRRKEEADAELRKISQRETALETTANANSKRLLGLEEQAQQLRNAKTKMEAQHHQAVNSAVALSREKDQLSQRVEQFRTKAERADEYQKRFQQKDNEATALAREAQMAMGKVQTLERQLAAAQGELRTLRQSQGQSLRKHFASLENRLSALSIAQKETQGRGSQLQQLTRQRDSLHTKVEQLLSQMSKLSLAARDSDCKGCARLMAQNSSLSKKIGMLEQSLRERESEVLRLSSRSTTVSHEQKSGTKVSVKDLLLSAQQLKGSNERMSRLIDSSSQYELRTVTKAVGSRLHSHRQ